MYKLITFIGPLILDRQESARLFDIVTRELVSSPGAAVVHGGHACGVDAVVDFAAGILKRDQIVLYPTGRVFGQKRLMWRPYLRAKDKLANEDWNDRDVAIVSTLADAPQGEARACVITERGKVPNDSRALTLYREVAKRGVSWSMIPL